MNVWERPPFWGGDKKSNDWQADRNRLQRLDSVRRALLFQDIDADKHKALDKERAALEQSLRIKPRVGGISSAGKVRGPTPKENRKASGLCERCGKNELAESGALSCTECRRKKNEARERRKARGEDVSSGTELSPRLRQR